MQMALGSQVNKLTELEVNGQNDKGDQGCLQEPLTQLEATHCACFVGNVLWGFYFLNGLILWKLM